SDRFFYLCGLIILLYVLSFFLAPLFSVTIALMIVFLLVFILDAISLFTNRVVIDCERVLPKILSLGDENEIKLVVSNKGNQSLTIQIIDELPEQLQIRDFSKTITAASGEELVLNYPVRPIVRGEYSFGNINLFISSRIGLAERRIIIPAAADVPVYPSIIQMKNMELKAFNRISTQKGIKKIRRIGHSYEFEQIKSYVRGDDYRSLNWKASSRRASLMVNQYEDERAQQIYCIIDKSRAMRMPFNDMSLMDYAINSTLVISNIALQKYDKAGLITFSDKIGSSIKADSKSTHLNKILHALYKEKERPLEANYELLYYASRKIIHGRSLILLFTNFESSYSLERVLPILRKINKLHLLVVVFFENTEIKEFSDKPVDTLEDIYHQTVAKQFLNEKTQMVNKLQQYGIQAVLTSPNDLSVNTVNKYLELKSRGLI
ncbi:MAG: DUF58 domain-containing protein, partial [Bacteroidota bacterium]